MPSINPQRAEIWQINFDPQVGSEIKKERPALILDAGDSTLDIRIAVPITSWKSARDEQNPFKVYIQPTSENGLSKECAADVYQIKSVSLERFVERRGHISQSKADEVAEAVGLLIDIPPVSED